jgi:hypothetical protein
MLGTYDDHGVRFEYPAAWEVDVTDDGPRTTVALQSPTGLAFVLVTLDETRPEPDELADEALGAMREEYPALEASPARETIDGHPAVGHDVEFFSLDLVTSCTIRSYRTPRRTVLLFGQWAEVADEDDPGAALKAVRGSIEETDA